MNDEREPRDTPPPDTEAPSGNAPAAGDPARPAARPPDDAAAGEAPGAPPLHPGEPGVPDAAPADDAGGEPPVEDAEERAARPPRVRLGAASGVLTAVVIAALVVINVLGTRISHTFDLTANHAYTLSGATLKVLRELKQPVQIYGFLQSGSSQGSEIHSLLDEYRRAGGSKVNLQVIDPAAQPALAQRYGVVQYNDVVVVSGNSHATATPTDMFSSDPATGSPVFDGESAITNAILRAANPQHLAVYFLSGHNEQQTGSSYTLVQQAVTGAGYTVQNLDLLTQTNVPKGAAAVVIAGPQRDLAPAEVAALERYAAGGGHLFVMVDPLLSGAPTRLYGLLKTFGVDARDDVVVDPAANRHFQAQPATLVPQVEAQAITNPLLQASLPVLLPASVSLAPAKGQKAYKVTPLLATSSSSYAKTNLHSTSLNFNAKTDIKGPFDVGVAVTSTVKGNGFKMVVLGSSTFALDTFFNTIPGNHDLFLNSVAWLTGQSAGIRIRPIKALQNTIVLTGNAMRGLFYGYIILLPALALVGALAVWSWRRRL